MSELGDSILECDDSKREAVEIPEWGKTVYVRDLRAIDRTNWLKAVNTSNGDIDPYAKERLLVKCVVDKDDVRLFQDDQAERLAHKSSKPVERLWLVADRINSVSDDQIESAEKN